MSENDLPQNTQYKGALWTLGVIASAVLVVMLALATWWSQEPDPFNVYDEAIERSKLDETTEIPLGYVYANTLAHIAEVLLHKPGGYITNDAAPPGVFMDNMPNWELGALVILRDSTTALRNHFARDQSQSAEDPDLAIAEPHFYYERNSWALPSTEAEYQKGIDALHDYMVRLQKPSGKKAARFYSRADNLWQFTEIVIKRLGNLSVRLAASTEKTYIREMTVQQTLNPEAEKLRQEHLSTEPLEQTPWLLIDDIFWEARGSAWALLHVLKAIEHDFRGILISKRAMNTVDIMIRALESSLQPILSPMILNGSGYGLFANYSLTMANYIARCNAAALDLRDILTRG